ncbi:hypothetical protein BGAL_0755g00050 [Botrytis galanthina]|uniref:Uncharacterized protein n=1 Tax=Botrytis galanthina TaxID=278940 RepID=A0A4S8QRE6_9HELO|nr:hypothetical protein BGAL_0755g00050 [Botrytis galanthina]
MVEGNTNLPTEIHVVLFGFAGFGVNIGAWREFLDCIELWDTKERLAGRKHEPKLADRIFLVPSVEPEVVDGTAAYSLIPGKDLSADTEVFEGFADKCWGKFRLTSLHRRAVFHEFNKANINAGLPELSYQTIDPIWDDVEKNDIFLEALDQEYRHRSAVLSSTTIPTHKNVQNRNLMRNRF